VGKAPDMTFDHIGVVVARVEQYRPVLARVFGVSRFTEVFRDPLHKVIVQFGQDPSGIVYELIEPLGDDSPVAKVMRSGQNILNHVAYLVPDLARAAARLRSQGGLPLTGPAPAVAFGGNPVQFFLTPLRIVLELVEGRTPAHDFRAWDAIDLG